MFLFSLLSRESVRAMLEIWKSSQISLVVQLLLNSFNACHISAERCFYCSITMLKMVCFSAWLYWLSTKFLLNYVRFLVDYFPPVYLTSLSFGLIVFFVFSLPVKVFVYIYLCRYICRDIVIMASQAVAFLFSTFSCCIAFLTHCRIG